jgi:hypothetical protein
MPLSTYCSISHKSLFTSYKPNLFKMSLFTSYKPTYSKCLYFDTYTYKSAALSIIYNLYSIFYILYSIFYILYSIFYILYSIFYILYSIFCQQGTPIAYQELFSVNLFCLSLLVGSYMI